MNGNKSLRTILLITDDRTNGHLCIALRHIKLNQLASSVAFRRLDGFSPTKF
ncbi:hypothetical protein [Vitreoscilla stercoraria]|uniref:hypothetical protein n=1 Tax=Vitreoscilla stercoraria TaxID=61 RepID=UPI0012DC2B36|nr:hypothetical protein [Vitreoscilla stercoraria]